MGNRNSLGTCEEKDNKLMRDMRWWCGMMWDDVNDGDDGMICNGWNILVKISLKYFLIAAASDLKILSTLSSWSRRNSCTWASLQVLLSGLHSFIFFSNSFKSSSKAEASSPSLLLNEMRISVSDGPGLASTHSLRSSRCQPLIETRRVLG